MASRGPLLEISKLSKYFGALPALAEVSFAVPAAQVTALIGPNGAGKTTLINCLTGVLRPEAGEVRFRGQELLGRPPHQLARLGVARTFQNLRLFPRLSVLDNVLCGLSGQGGTSFWEALLRLPRLRHRERHLRLQALKVLDDFGLTARAELPAGILPYGDKKRLELARAVVAQPALLLLDEPVAGLNRQETLEISQIIQRLRQEGMTLLLVEHDMDMVMSVADQVVVLDGGRRIATGTPAEVCRNPLVLEAYLGRASVTA